MTPESLLAFAAFAFVASVTPGPNNVLLTATGAAVGIARGMPVLFGIVLGFAFMNFVLALGLGQFVLGRPEMLDVLRYVGAAFLLFLSWQIALAPVAQAQETAEPRRARATGFVGAALFQWVNPKAWLVVASAIASHSSASGSAMVQAMLFAGVFFIAGLMGCLPWLAFGAGLKRWLTSPKSARAFNVAMGLTLAASTALIFL